MFWNNRPHLWEEKDSKWICLRPKARAMQGNPNPESRKLFCLLNLEILMEEFGILGFGIRNPWRGIQNPGLSWIPLFRATRRALTTDARRNWNSLMTYFIYLGSVISNEDGSRRDNNKVSPGKVWRVFSNNTASRLKSNCITAVRVNKLGAFIRQEY